MSRHWPLYGLRIRTPRLELRLPDEADLDDLIDVALDGVHDPAQMPFDIPWTDVPAADLPASFLQYHWHNHASFGPDQWSLDLAVVVDGQPIGVQGIGSERFPALREFTTGSWIGRRFHGQGIGTEMRTAVLQFAFDHLAAEYANSGAWWDNAASLAVSRKLGYRDNGRCRKVRRDTVDEQVQLRLGRADWEPRRRTDIEVTGYEPCRPLFGLD
jgi:RimJ/RimL family protein N-acetyltransferase